MPWGDRAIPPGAGKPRDEALRADYVKLIGIRAAHPALSRGTHTAISTDGDLLVFSQKSGEDEVIVAVNRGSEAASAMIPAPWAVPSVTDVWNGETLSVIHGTIHTNVKPRGQESS